MKVTNYEQECTETIDVYQQITTDKSSLALASHGLFRLWRGGHNYLRTSWKLTQALLWLWSEIGKSGPR